MQNRKWHRKLALIVLLPFIIILLTGILLQIKQWVRIVEPASASSVLGKLSNTATPIGLQDMLKVAQSVPKAEVSSWNDVRTIKIKPSSGVAKLLSKTNYEIQIDLSSGNVLSSGKSYSEFLIDIHEGSFFGNVVRNFIFLPVGLLLAFLTYTGFRLLVKKR